MTQSNKNTAVNSTVRNSLIVSSGTLISRLLGFIRMAVTLFVLVKVINDVFQFSNNLPNQVYDLLVSSAFNAVLVPAFVSAQKRADRNRFITAIFTVTLGVLAGITVVVTLAAPLIVKIMGVSLPEDWFWVVVWMSVLCLPQIFFYGMHTVLGQYLNANGRFAAYAWTPVLNNVIGIGGLLLFYLLYRAGTAAGDALSSPANWGPQPLLVLCGMTTLGIVVQALFLLIPVWQTGFRPEFPIRLRGLGLRAPIKQAMWAGASVFLIYVGVWAQSNVAIAAFSYTQMTGIEVPSVSERTVATLFYAVPYAVLILSVVNVIFPDIVRAVEDSDKSRLESQMLRFHSFIGPIGVLCSVLLMTGSLLLAQLMTIVTEYDPFLIAIVLAAISVGIIPLASGALNERVLYASNRAKYTFFAQIPANLFKLLTCGIAVFALPQIAWVPFAAFGEGIGIALYAIICHYAIKVPGRPSLTEELRCYLRPLLGGALAAAVGLGFLWLVGFYSTGYLDLLARCAGLLALEVVVFTFVGVSRETRKEFLVLLRHR